MNTRVFGPNENDDYYNVCFGMWQEGGMNGGDMKPTVVEFLFLICSYAAFVLYDDHLFSQASSGGKGFSRVRASSYMLTLIKRFGSYD